MLNVMELRKTAEEAFVAQMRDKVVFLTEKCWVIHIGSWLKEINDIIEAGKKMGVTSAETFTPDEMAEMVADLTPLRTLEMKTTARIHVVSFLAKKGVDPQIFGQKNEEK